MKKLKYQLTTKFFIKIIENKILVLQKNNILYNNIPNKSYTILLAKQLSFTNLIPFIKFKFPLSLFLFSTYLELQTYLQKVKQQDKAMTSIVFTKINSNIILKSDKNIKTFNSKEIFLNFSQIFNLNILILKALKLFK